MAGPHSNQNTSNGTNTAAKDESDGHQSQDDFYQVHTDRGELIEASGGMDEINLERSVDYLSHCHPPRRVPSNLARNQLLIVSVLCFVFMVAEIVGGIVSNSLALISDGTHMASDLTGFMVSLVAIWMAKKKPSVRMSFGFYRTEIIGAMVSILIIWVATVVLVFFAVDRIRHPIDIEADEMLIVAGLGIGFNIVMGLVLHSGLCKKCQVPHSHLGHGHSHSHSHMADSTDDDEVHPASSDPENINVRAAMIHVCGDLIQSIGVFIAAIIIKVKPEYKIADPICTFIFSVLVLTTTIIVLYDVGIVLMEGVPRSVSYSTIKKELEHIEGVQSVHSLNIWSLTMDKVAVAAHLAIRENGDWATVLRSATHLLRDKYGVFQSTVQVEPYEDVMASCQQCQQPEAPAESSCTCFR